MTQVIGREREKKILENLLDKEEAQLLAVYGRRRTGKTYLMREFFKRRGLFFEVSGILCGKMSEQLWNFTESFHDAFKLESLSFSKK